MDNDAVKAYIDKQLGKMQTMVAHDGLGTINANGQMVDELGKEVFDAFMKPGAFVPVPKQPSLPTDAKTRKAAPIASGVLDYFPDALFAVAELSRIGNEQHNPGKPMHWDKTKSMDHADCIIRHLIDRGTLDTDGVRHATKVAWRALALLQIEIEKERGNV